ncbi:MAG: hypothetical protein JRL30_24550 [Deltaproteobacteria bacterium]|nr:hypothetical protein [Deltaproteobacteria bacterium]
MLIGILVIFVTGCATPLPRLRTDNTRLPDALIEKRIRFIEERLDAHKRHGEIWYWSWMVVNSGAVVGLSVAAGVTDDTPDRVDFASQAGLAALGVADLLLRPLEARYGADPIRHLPEATRAEKLAKLRAAEDLLYRNAQRALERKDWVFHFLNLILNAGVGIATGAAGDATQGAISAGAGVVGGEIYILAQPAGPEKDWRQYETMVSDRSHEKMRLSLRPCDMGLRMTLRW